MEALRNFVAQLGTRRLMMMGGVAALLLAGLATLAFSGSTPKLGYLYTELEPAAAQAITEKLKAQNVPFEVSADGTAVLAPQDQLAQLRMSLASEQLGGKLGYEVLDQEEPFGISSSRARINETRAIEGELTRSIESLDRVSKARVHIVMPERALFSDEARKATAAVTVKTSGRLPSGTVQSIRYLVSSAVPELSPESVSIVDQAGSLLARAGEDGEAGASAMEEQQAAIEARLRSQIEAMIAPIVGAGKVRAEVSALLDREQRREEADLVDPDRQAIARQITVESADQNQESEAGAAAATVAAQLPENAGQPGGAGQDSRRSARNENSEDTTYENSRTRTVSVRAPGKINRLTVAVMVDGGSKGVPAGEIQRLTRLVENAVGFDAERGDSVVVEAMEFAAEDLGEAEAGLPFGLTVDHILSLVKFIILCVVGIVALRLLKSRKDRQEPAPGLAALTADPELQELKALAAEGDEDAIKQLEAKRESESDLALLDQEIALAQVDGRVKLSALKKIGDAVAGSPAESASVIRQWMNA